MKEEKKEIEKKEIEPKRKVKPVRSANSLESKLKKIESSKLPESEKMRYKKMLAGPEKSKPGIPFDVYANIRCLRGGEKAAKSAYAVSKGKSSLSKKEWDELFKNF